MVKKILKYLLSQYKDAFNKAYIICLFIAFSLWALIKFSVIYQDNIAIEIELNNLPDSWIVVNESQQVIKCNVKTSGFRLLLLSVSPNINVELNIEDLKLNADSNYVFDILKNEQEKLPDWLIKSNFHQYDKSEIEFQLSKLTRQTVSIKPNINLEFKPGYLLDELILEMDSVTVLRPESSAHNTKSIFTKEMNLSNVSKDENIQLEFEIPEYWKLLDSKTTIEAKIQVDQYTQGNQEIVLKKDTLRNIQYFPSRVNILYSVPSKGFNSISENDFILDIENIKASENGNALKVLVVQKPKSVNVLAIQPAEVEFLIFDDE